jgi:hypothetical protein
VVECLLCKHEALNSNSSFTHTQKKKITKTIWNSMPTYFLTEFFLMTFLWTLKKVLAKYTTKML